MALDALRCNHLVPLGFKGLSTHNFGWLENKSYSIYFQVIQNVCPLSPDIATYYNDRGRRPADVHMQRWRCTDASDWFPPERSTQCRTTVWARASTVCTHLPTRRERLVTRGDGDGAGGLCNMTRRRTAAAVTLLYYTVSALYTHEKIRIRLLITWPTG